jgi:predicted polyphosphate/ATP-dependent NAD kinase
MRRIGFLINPVAGMGGSVGLKGTDGKVAEALRRGAEPRAQERAKSALRSLAGAPDVCFITCSGLMGEEILEEAGVKNYRVEYRFLGETTSEDTKNAVKEFEEAKVDLILFCGGDGTARDILDVTGRKTPILGIPAGVKMYSAVFAVDPETAAEIVQGFDTSSLRDSEVLDVDEEAYRSGILTTRLYGFARVPYLAGKTQVSKQVFEESSEERAKEEIARFIQEVMLPDALYILGAGTTLESVARRIGIKKTLLGVDVIKNGTLVAADVDEKALVALTQGEKDVRILISPIGAQGFLFGRGNQQISAQIIRRAGIRHVIAVATPHKLRETPELYVDTGDPLIDREFGDTIQVISGYRIAQRKKIHQHNRDKKN